MNDVSRRIQAIEDRHALADLRGHYCHLVDDRDWEALAALFCDDGEFIGFAHAKGRSEILRFFRNTVDGLTDGMWHFCTNPTLTLEGDAASGRLTLQYLSVKDGVSYVSAGHYDDEFRREDGVWKFRRRRITFYYYAPLTAGFVGEPTYIRTDGTPLTPAERTERLRR
jgi:ketosteroid isomerase-like protein